MANVPIAVFRYMPPTSPVAPGFSCISIVFARTIVGGEDHGIKPFVFQLHDGQSMTPGVKIKCAMISNHIPTCRKTEYCLLEFYLHAVARALSTTV
jgi:hypothetical protein